MNKTMPIGADYYPEHWPRERWPVDAKLMQEAGFNTTRLAEFAWAKMEPREGVFDFDWLEDAIGVLAGHGIKVLLCTPTPTMPKWVYDRYPETISQDKNGHFTPFGNRHNNCYSSPMYRMLSRRITNAIAERFKGNPNVIGWQLDNELGGGGCFCPACETYFRDWLKNKYGDINKLNETWGTMFWSHAYAGFEELHLPRHEYSSPSLHLDWRRFYSGQVVSFAKEQADIIREKCPGHFITHNLMGMHEAINYFDLGKLLDFVSEDYYYNYGSVSYEKRFDTYIGGAKRLDFIRGVKHKPFWIMENTAGPLGWETYSRNIRPGELKRMTFQNMAHGAAGQIWFRWRTSRFGTEQYWHGILDHSGIPGRRYNEAAALTPLMQKVFEKTNGAEVTAEAAIFTDYEDHWAFGQQPNAEDFRYASAMNPYYRALHKMGAGVDFIKKDDEFGKYKLIVLPYKYILTQELANELLAYVENGGILLATCRTGAKDEFNVSTELPLPGYLRKAAGIRIEEYEAVDSYMLEYRGEPYAGKTLADWIILEGAEEAGKFTEPGIPYAAITANKYGKGMFWYVGTVPEDKLASKLLSDLLKDAGIKTYCLPENVEMVVQKKGGDVYYFLLNHGDNEAEVELAGIKGVDILTGTVVDGIVKIAANDVMVVG